MNETAVILCVALVCFSKGELVEHTYQKSVWRTALRPEATGRTHNSA